jgi:hypothetical protein
MWPTCKPYQRELNWTESFPTVLGDYILLPELTVLWGNPEYASVIEDADAAAIAYASAGEIAVSTADAVMTAIKTASADAQKNSLYQFSARSTKYSASYCSKGNLCLIDFRHAAVILSDIQATFNDTELNISKPYTPETVATMCMHMKELAKYYDFGRVRFIIDGILIPTIHGNHIVLFDLKAVKPCIREDPPMKLGMYVEYTVSPNITPLCIASIKQNEYLKRLFVVGAHSTNPIDCVLHEGSIYEFSHSNTIPIKEWHSMEFIHSNTIYVKEWLSFARLELLGFRHPNLLLLYPDTADMATREYHNIVWNEPEKSFLPVYGSCIQLREHTVLWRGYDRMYPALGNRPVYFGERIVAESYARTSPTHALGVFATTKPLKLLDVRFLKILLSDLLSERSGDAVLRTTVAFGLCSFYHQLRLMITLYKDLVRTDPGYKAMESMLNTNNVLEQPGVRVAETSNDGWVMAFLGEVFDGIADGFIAPKLFSPYQHHTGSYLHPEIVVFNPVKSGIAQLTSIPQLKDISIPYVINQQYPSPITLRALGMETTYVAPHHGGRRTPHTHDYVPALEAFNDELNRGNKNAVALHRQAVKEGKKLRKKVVFSI